MAVRTVAAAARVPVFLALGGGARAAVDAVLADARVRRVASPRHATVLLVVGAIPEPMATPLARVHDQIPHPRATVWWGGPPEGQVIPAARVLPPTAGTDEVLAAVVAQHGAVVTGAGADAPDLLPDEPPNPWEGIGPHGQGGEGMMMGTPYGRPMAMTADDRDGLALDQLGLRLGPFLAPFPPGLTLRVALQGDVLQDVGVEDNPFAGAAPVYGTGIAARDGDAPDLPPTAVERLRAARLLGAVATALEVQHLDAPALRARAAAHRLRTATSTPGVEGVAGDVGRLVSRLRRARLLRSALRGVGVTTGEHGRLLAGVDTGGDAWARLCQRLAEIETSLDLALRAGANVAGPRAGERRRTDPRILNGLLPGAEIGDALATVASLDLDLEAARSSVPAGVET